MSFQVSILWTDTALKTLRTLPKEVQRALLEKADMLLATDPRQAHKPLTGPLQGCYRITCGRYRAIYRVDVETLRGGNVLLHLKVLFLVAGIRKERDKRDIYNVAEKLVKLIIRPSNALPSAEAKRKPGMKKR